MSVLCTWTEFQERLKGKPEPVKVAAVVIPDPPKNEPNEPEKEPKQNLSELKLPALRTMAISQELKNSEGELITKANAESFRGMTGKKELQKLLK